MERDIKKIIRRNRKALGMATDIYLINSFVSVNTVGTVEAALSMYEDGYDPNIIIADGLIVGYEPKMFGWR